MESYVGPTLGKVRLHKLTAGQVEKLYDQLADDGLPPASIRLVHMCLHNLLKLAKRRRLVGHAVTELVDHPKAVNRRKVDGKVRITIDDVKTEAGGRDTPLPRWAVDALRQIGLESEGSRSIRMHDIQHSKGTLMANEGEDLVVIKRTLGHAKLSITADLYVGQVPKALRSAAARCSDLLDPTTQVPAENTGKAVS